MIQREDFAEVLSDLTIVFDVELRAGRAELYYSDLKKFSRAVLEEAARDLRKTCKRFPTLAEWVERSKAIAARRARTAAARTRTATETLDPMSWETAAKVVLAHAAIAGVAIGDKGVRDRALEIANDELRMLREDYGLPRDVPRSQLMEERRRIVGVLVRELAGYQRSSVSDPV